MVQHSCCNLQASHEAAIDAVIMNLQRIHSCRGLEGAYVLRVAALGRWGVPFEPTRDGSRGGDASQPGVSHVFCRPYVEHRIRTRYRQLSKAVSYAATRRYNDSYNAVHSAGSGFTHYSNNQQGPREVSQYIPDWHT